MTGWGEVVADAMAMAGLTRRRRRTTIAPTVLADGAIPARPIRTSLVDSAIYVDGCRVASPKGLPESIRELRRHLGAVAWIGLYRPDRHDLDSLQREFGLHQLAVDDAIAAHQRPKVERYGETVFMVLRPARYLDDVEEVEFGEVHLFAGPDFVITLRHSEAPDLADVRHRLEDSPELLARGPSAILYAVLDRVVDEYAPVVAGLENDIDEIETEVFDGDPKVSRRIYQLTREVIDFERAVTPLCGMIATLNVGIGPLDADEELRRHLRDVEDHVIAIVEQVSGYHQLLRDMLTVNATLVAQQQNEEMRALSVAGHEQNEEVKRISSWAAILFAPTVVGGIYGMNFSHMPELGWVFGYPMAILLMFLVSLTLYVVFKRRGWL